MVKLARATLAAVALTFIGLGPANGAFPADPPNDPSFNTCGEAPPHLPGNPATNASCSFFSEQWQLYSYFPRNTPSANTAGNENSPPLPGSGLSADLAWATTIGRPDVVIAILDSGIDWDQGDLTNKVALNTGELPLPTGAQCTSPGIYDCNADGVVNVLDYTGDPAVTDANGNTFIDPEDLIVAFSNSADGDSNGFKDDIAGWDTFRDDNNPGDDVGFGHGTGRARDAAASTDNAMGGAGVCPRCMLMPVRVGDSFVVSGHTFSQGVVYAVDNDASVVEAAVGAITSDAFMQQALDYAWSNGVLPVVASADEDSFHHSPPSSGNHALSVKAVIPNTPGTQSGSVGSTPLSAQTATTSFLSHAACTNFGGHIHLAIPTDSCSSGATSHAAGVAGLVYARALDAGLSPALTANEAKQLLTMSADDINIPGSGTTDMTKYPSKPGWDQYFGYGRVNANTAVLDVAAATIPPEADIIGPPWWSILDPTTTTSIPITGYVAATRATTFDIVVQCAVGVEPTDAQFLTTTIASSTANTVPISGTLATWDPSTQCTPPNSSGTPVSPDDFTVTLRVRVTDNLGNVGEDRKTVAVHHDSALVAGFPLDMPASLESSPALVDLDGDNTLEVISAAGDGRVYAYHQNGSAVTGFPVSALPIPPVDPGNANNHLASPAYATSAVTPSPDSFVASVAVGDLFRDGRQVVVAASLGGKVYAWYADGAPVAGFPVAVNPAFGVQGPSFDPFPGFVSSPALGDIDPAAPGLEIVTGGLDQHLYAWHADGTPVSGFPLLLNSPNPTSFSADDCGENKIVSSAAIGDVDADGLADIVIGTNEAFADSSNCGDQLLGSGRAYVVSNTGVVKTVINVHSRIVPLVLPGVANGVPTSPALADLDANGTLEIAIPALGSRPDLDVIIFKHDGTAFTTLTSTFSNASSTDSPFLSLLGNGAFGDLNADGKPDYVLGGVGFKLLLRFAFPGNRLDHDHLISAWDPSTGALLSGMPRRIDDWQFLNDPIVASIDPANPSATQLISGSGGYLVHAFNAAGTEPAGWPRFTNGWITGSAAAGDLGGDGQAEVLIPTREGRLFAWSTGTTACPNAQWWRYRHDEWNTGRYGADTRRPNAVLNLIPFGSGLAWTAPGQDGRCGTAARYEVRFAPAPITQATWASATSAVGVPAPLAAGNIQFMPGSALPPGTHYVVVRGVDAAGNLAAMGNNASITVPCLGTDADCDGTAEASDNCPGLYNYGQANADRNFTDLTPPKANDDLTWINSDAAGDACDADDDNDALADTAETGCNGGAATSQLLRDTDGDRRLDGAECANGSDPANAGSVPATGCTVPGSPDTDGDGLRDALEVCYYNSSTSSTNTDGDTCGDAREVMSMDTNTTVNAADLGLTASAFGGYGTPPAPANVWRVNMDADKNGTVNAADLGLVASTFGACP